MSSGIELTAPEREAAESIALGVAQALVCVLGALASPGDDVIAVGPLDRDLLGVPELVRVRVRTSTLETVFDAIGEHTRALLASDPDDDTLEALLGLELPVLAFSRGAGAEGPAPDRMPGALVSIARLDGELVRVRCAGAAAAHAVEIERRIRLLSPPGQLASARALVPPIET